MPGSMPATSQLDWLSSMTAMIVLFWSRATRDLLKSFGWGIAGTPSIRYSDEVAISRRPPHSIYRSRSYDRYPNGLKKAPELCAHGQPRCVRTREVRGRNRYSDNRMVRIAIPPAHF